MIPLDLDKMEAAMVLMVRHEVDEIACEQFTIKKTRHGKLVAKELDPKLLLEQHLQPMPNEPWNSIPQEDVDQWAGVKP